MQESVWVGLYWFHTCIFPEDVKRLEFWVWAGMKGTRVENWNSEVSNTLVCVQHTTHTSRLLREITGNFLCVHSLEMGLCEKPEVHSQLVIVASSWRVVWKDHQVFAVVTLAWLHPALWQQLVTDTGTQVEGFFSSPELPSLLLTKKPLCLFWNTEQDHTLLFRSVLYCSSPAQD